MKEGSVVTQGVRQTDRQTKCRKSDRQAVKSNRTREGESAREREREGGGGERDRF